MISKNKIMDSFEEFIALPLSILKRRIIQITGFKSDFVTTKSIDVEINDDKININVINNECAYNLLSTVAYKRNKKLQEKVKSISNAVSSKNENSKSKVYLELHQS